MSALEIVSFSAPQLSSIALQNELKNSILRQEDAKITQLIAEHPQLLHAPFEDGSLPLHFAIDAHRSNIARKFMAMNTDPLTKDSNNLDTYDHAYIAGENALGVHILQNIRKQIPQTILNQVILLRIGLSLQRQQMQEVRQSLPAQTQETIAEQVNQKNSHNWTPLETALDGHKTRDFLNLLLLGADPKQKTHDGNSLLHQALFENQIDALHLLLFAGLAPNEKTKEDQTPLSIAAKAGNMQAVYLLLAYGAILTPDVAEMLANTARSHDPLHIGSADAWFFLSTGAYWLAKGLISTTNSNPYLENLPTAIHLLGATWMLYSQLPEGKQLWKKVAVVTGLLGMQVMPGCNIATQIWKTASVASSAFTGMQAVFANYATRPWQALKKCLVHTVNVTQSASLLRETAIYEYNQSELIKELYRDNSLIPEVLSEYAHWDCDNFKKLFRAESLKHHPDKNQNPEASTSQTVLNSVYRIWKNYCN